VFSAIDNKKNLDLTLDSEEFSLKYRTELLFLADNTIGVL